MLLELIMCECQQMPIPGYWQVLEMAKNVCTLIMFEVVCLGFIQVRVKSRGFTPFQVCTIQVITLLPPHFLSWQDSLSTVKLGRSLMGVNSLVLAGQTCNWDQIWSKLQEVKSRDKLGLCNLIKRQNVHSLSGWGSREPFTLACVNDYSYCCSSFSQGLLKECADLQKMMTVLNFKGTCLLTTWIPSSLVLA